MELKSGDLIEFWSEEYADRMLHGTYKVLRDVSGEEISALTDQVKLTKATRQAEMRSLGTPYWNRICHDFIEAMIAKGWIEEKLAARQIHLGDSRLLHISEMCN